MVCLHIFTRDQFRVFCLIQSHKLYCTQMPLVGHHAFGRAPMATGPQPVHKTSSMCLTRCFVNS